MRVPFSGGRPEKADDFLVALHIGFYDRLGTKETLQGGMPGRYPPHVFMPPDRIALINLRAHMHMEAMALAEGRARAGASREHLNAYVRHDARRMTTSPTPEGALHGLPLLVINP